MAKQNNNTQNITATVNGIVFENLTFEQAAQLAAMANSTIDNDKPEKPENDTKEKKPENVKTRNQAKAEKHESAKHYIVVSNKVSRIANDAIKRASEKHSVNLELARDEEFCITKKGECSWIWLIPTDNTLTKKNGKEIAASLPKKRVTDKHGKTNLVQVWKYSSKRNAIFRDYGEDIRA